MAALPLSLVTVTGDDNNAPLAEDVPQSLASPSCPAATHVVATTTMTVAEEVPQSLASPSCPVAVVMHVRDGDLPNDGGESKSDPKSPILYPLDIDITSLLRLAFQINTHPLGDVNYCRLLRQEANQRRIAQGKGVIPSSCPLHVWILEEALSCPLINVKTIQYGEHMYYIIHYKDNIRWLDQASPLLMIARGLIIRSDGMFFYTMPKFFETGQVSPDKLEIVPNGPDTLIIKEKKYDGAAITLISANGELKIFTHGSLQPNEVTKAAYKHIGDAKAIVDMMQTHHINSLCAEVTNQSLGKEVDNPSAITIFAGYYKNTIKIPHEVLTSMCVRITSVNVVSRETVRYEDLLQSLVLEDNKSLTDIKEGFVAHFPLGVSLVPVKVKMEDWLKKADIPNPNKRDKSKESYVSRVIGKFSNHDDHAIVTRIAGQMWDYEKSLLADAEQQKEAAAHAIISEVVAVLELDPKPESFQAWRIHFRKKILSGNYEGKTVGFVLGKLKNYL